MKREKMGHRCEVSSFALDMPMFVCSYMYMLYKTSRSFRPLKSLFILSSYR